VWRVCFLLLGEVGFCLVGFLSLGFFFALVFGFGRGGLGLLAGVERDGGLGLCVFFVFLFMIPKFALWYNLLLWAWSLPPHSSRLNCYMPRSRYVSTCAFRFFFNKDTFVFLADSFSKINDLVFGIDPPFAFHGFLLRREAGVLDRSRALCPASSLCEPFAYY